ncbi:flagellin [uncultured Clostridium sp.]|uniref:flagellin n=1 Tax=uncultured Clostridium sp. TaxID=59620 RepID=UPI0028E8B0DC|nr:flagellin [uncultured Clostridium sp.]
MLINNIYTFSSSNKINSFRKNKGTVLEKVSSGRRINRAADDAAGLTISESFKAQVRGLSQAERNIQDGISMLQMADGALDDITKHLHRMKELAVHGANGTLTESDRDNLNSEFKQLKESIDSIAENTEFNNIKLLKEDKTITLQVRDTPYTTMGIKLYSVNTDSLNIDSNNLATSESAGNSIEGLREALARINEVRVNIGSYSNNLQHALSNTTNANENTTASLSRIKDVDMAASVMNMVKSDILSKYSEMLYSNVKGNIESIKNLIY